MNTRKTLLTLWTLLTLALLQVAATCDGSECHNDFDCEVYGDQCYFGECVECVGDGDCRTAHGVPGVCDANACVLVDCNYHFDCGQGQRCYQSSCLDADEVPSSTSNPPATTPQQPPATTPQTLPPSMTLAVPAIPQQTQVWCWAAVSEMLLRYANAPRMQCEIVGTWVRTNCCDAQIAQAYCLHGAPSLQVIQQTLLGFGNIRTQLTGPMSFEQIKQTIASGRPIIAAYSNSFSGHVVVIHGYDERGNIHIIDPYYGQFVVPHGATFQYNGQMIWSNSIIPY